MSLEDPRHVPFIEVGNTDWFEFARCSSSDVENVKHRISVFFPEQRGKNTNEAKRICAECEVSDDCYQYAVDNDINDGVWGGVTMSLRPSRRSKLIR